MPVFSIQLTEQRIFGQVFFLNCRVRNRDISFGIDIATQNRHGGLIAKTDSVNPVCHGLTGHQQRDIVGGGIFGHPDAVIRFSTQRQNFQSRYQHIVFQLDLAENI